MDAHRWLANLPSELEMQVQILLGLLEVCEKQTEARVFLVGCSIGRGVADELSDVDCFIGVRKDAVDTVVDAVCAALPGMGKLVDVLQHAYKGQLRRIFAQFGSGAQLDLVVAEALTGRAPDEVVLYDPDALMSTQRIPSVDVVTVGDVREWTFLGWVALADMSKYLHRGSTWEALDRLSDARTRIWSLWAAAKGARYPVFGLSQVLDRDPNDLPLDIEETVADLNPTHLASAGASACLVLAQVSSLAAHLLGGEVPTAMQHHVTSLFGAVTYENER